MPHVESPHGTFPFLNLVKELRDQIYNDMLELEFKPPPSPENTGGRRLRAATLGSRAFYKLVSHLQGGPLRTSSLGLLLCNKQVSREIQDAILRKNARSNDGVTYKLDCMLRKNQLLATWTSLPAATKCVQRVEVEMRCFGRITFVGPDKVTHDLLRLLADFFVYGPGYCGAGPSEPIVLKTLTVKLTHVSLDGELGDAFQNFRHSIFCFKSFFDRLSTCGLLYGKVETLRLWWEGNFRETQIVDRGDTTKVAVKWAHYGWTPGLFL